jgi:hypothetical protein
VLKKLTVAVLACLTLFLSKRSMSDGQPRRERAAFSSQHSEARFDLRAELTAER